MVVRTNPFHELYLGESVGPDKFVNLFSDVIIENALSLFQPGNVILKGLPGSGKSMLLNLFKPSIRLAYAKAGQEFPVPSSFSKFVGAGINLKRSGISDFGQRSIHNDRQNSITLPLYFGDFLNYWVVSDIFRSVETLYTQAPNKELIQNVGVEFTPKRLELFTKKFITLDCWQGYLSNLEHFSDIEKRINGRITLYRSFLNYNSDSLPLEIQKSKTIIGIPISQTVQLLKEYKILDADTEVYIRIDQYEELAWLDEASQGLGSSYKEIIHKLLGMRDSSVSYRIGTRYFAWTGEEKMYGSTARLERERNYTEVAIDSVLRRSENSRTWIFPRFAEDIFRRRLNLSAYQFSESSESLISKVFGESLTPSETAIKYVPNNRTKAILLEDNWPKMWKDFLIKLAQENPLSARLGEAWARQKGKEGIINDKTFEDPYPWEDKRKRWWKKERTEHALMQIASRNRQQLIWYGKDDLLGLSGGHILVFLSLCQHIWGVWIRDKRNEPTHNEIKLPAIDEVIQTSGILETSKHWFENISNEKGGKERKAFINYLGNMFYKTLVEDKAMSYPGHNGFSMTIEDLNKNGYIKDFIEEASNYGDLYDAPHTSKSSNKKARWKWYLNPVLSPYFKIPYAHTKEPIYINLDKIMHWFIESEVFNKNVFSDKHDSEIRGKEINKGEKTKKKNHYGHQGTLFM